MLQKISAKEFGSSFLAAARHLGGAESQF